MAGELMHHTNVFCTENSNVKNPDEDSSCGSVNENEGGSQPIMASRYIMPKMKHPKKVSAVEE